VSVAAGAESGESITFKSRVDRWLAAVLIGGAAFAVFVVLFAIAAGVATSGPVALLSALLLAPIAIVGAGLPLWLLKSTRYEVTATHLKVVSGPFRWSIPIKDIGAITRTANPLSSPALSLRRLRIEQGRGGVIMVSPEDETGFLTALKERGWRGSAASR